MAPQVDTRIPGLITATTAAKRLKCTSSWVHRLVDEGCLYGITVGRLMLLTEQQVDSLAKHRKAGASHWHPPDPAPPVPPLVSSTEAAELLGFAQPKSVRRLYREGELAGRQLGSDLVFRRAAVTQLALLRSVGWCT